MKDSYEDIIHLPHHVSRIRPQMPMQDRAAQFLPFAALSGYGEAVAETARLTEERRELDEEAKELLDAKQQYLVGMISEQPRITITRFVPDARKAGGAYVTVTGNLKRIDGYERVLILTDGTRISLDEIIDIEDDI